MTQHRIFLGTLALAVLVAACGQEDAGPTVSQLDTGSIKVTVLSDTGNAAVPNFTGRSGITVTVRPVDDALVLRRANTGTGGVLTLRGLPVGEYVVKPLVRPNTVFDGPESTFVTVERDSTDSSSVFRFRQGGRVSGFIGIQYIGQSGSVTERFPAGKIVQLLVDTAAVQTTGAPREYRVVFTDTTDAVGAFDLLGVPSTQRMGITFESGLANRSDSLRFGLDTLQGVRNATVTWNSNSGMIGGSVTQNFLFTYQSAISGRVFRDYNKNGIYDGASENLIANDTVNVQLRNATGEQVVATARVLSTSSNQSYTFSSVQPGDYRVALVRATSRFPGTPGFTPKDTTIAVNVPTTKSRVTANLPLVPVP